MSAEGPRPAGAGQWLPASSPLRVSWIRELGSFSPTISTVLPRWAYLVHSQGGFRLYTEADVSRLMVIRRMKPLGFTLDEMRALLEATDRLDADDELPPGEREALLDRIRGFEQAAQHRVEDLRTQLSRAEEFAATLAARLRTVPAGPPEA
ncbi:MerR family DNA-binding protein [Streptomyces sp. SAS_269]|uniref:MerR family DNA-binding protein n=1 Tax=Streptomyces sp. SAS_269 TaxID=3412749 RepID=UPI00403C03A6